MRGLQAWLVQPCKALLTLRSCRCVSACCRGALLPDPRHDAVRAIVLAVADDDEEVPDGG